jgi:hypothetical protein
MAAQTLEQGRYLGGRPPYGYRLADAGPHPNKAHAAWGRRSHRLEPDPATAPVVTWMFSQRLAGHSAARITRALNDAGVRARQLRTQDGIRTGPGARAALIDQLRADRTVLTYDPASRTLSAGGHDAPSVAIGKDH